MAPKKYRKKKTSSSPIIVTLIIIFLLLFLLALFHFFKPWIKSSHIASDEAKNSLQLATFLHKTSITTNVPAPTPTSTLPECGHDDGLRMTNNCTCSGDIVITCTGYSGGCIDAWLGSSHIGCGGNLGNYYCDPSRIKEGGGRYCVAKPVIYLYPEKDTLVSVSVKTAGKVVISDPLYPAQGWENVLAHPNGTLNYRGKNYRELFYESESTTLNTPSKGVIIKSNELESKLKQYIALLGLTRSDEQKEFLDWWVPRLQALNEPYIFFSILEPQEKLRLDQVNISPQPDTFIQFIVYFKPMDKLQPINKLELSPAPERKGFTAIEWGGIIDDK